MSNDIAQAQGSAVADPLQVRGAIFALQDAMTGMPQVECPLLHHFAPGMYARTIFVPAGTCVVTKIHRHTHITVVSMGRAKVVTERGEEIVEAPFTMVTPAGTKRAVFTITDTMWTTIHLNPTDTQDLEAIEADLIAPSYDALGLEDKPASALTSEVPQ